MIARRKSLFKIGFTTTPVKRRISRAEFESAYLMAPVEIVSEYRTYNLKTSALEHLLHRLFADSRLQISQIGPDGRAYDSTEWFEVPISVIDQAINLIVNGDILLVSYNAQTGELLRPEQ